MTEVLDRSVVAPDPAPCAGGSCSPRPSSAPTIDEDLTPIDRYLREQQTMTAVDRFSRHHDEQDRVVGRVPDQARYYRDLIPLEQPVAGQQFGFDVDLDACSGCKACVTACHSLNGLDDGEAFRSVGTLHVAGSVDIATDAVLDLSTLTIEPWQQTVTTACHHCVDPACLNGCPVDAYEKDPVTGIVSHLDDQCIGCSYCTLMCPYEVPALNAERGIVRKCDLCKDRLAVGEAPACVQACPTSAISVRIVEVAELVERARPVPVAGAPDQRVVPHAPSSRLTVPTTRYHSARPIPDGALPADHLALQPAHAHPPLTIMLVLTQLAVGAFAIAWLLESTITPTLALRIRPFATTVSLGVGLLALAASTLHLGRPQYAWRAVIGLRHSWLSREIVAFGAFAALATAYAAAMAFDVSPGLVRPLGALVVIAGIAGVICSVMVYAATGKRWWRVRVVTIKFVLTAVMTGASTVVVAALIATRTDPGFAATAIGEIVRPLALVVLGATVLKLFDELTILRHLGDAGYPELRRTALLLTDDLGEVTMWRSLAGVFGGIALPLLLLGILAAPQEQVAVSTVVVAMVALASIVVGELCERWQFFAAVATDRMPGARR